MAGLQEPEFTMCNLLHFLCVVGSPGLQGRLILSLWEAGTRESFTKKWHWRSWKVERKHKDSKDWGMKGKERKRKKERWVHYDWNMRRWGLSENCTPTPLAFSLLSALNKWQYQLTFITILLGTRHYYTCLNSMNPQDMWRKYYNFIDEETEDQGGHTS